MPARASAFCVAAIGPRPMTSGAQPATATDLIFASGVRPCFAAYSAVQTSTAAAPSVSGEAVPAVTVPSWRNAGFRPASPSVVVSARMQPSCDTRLPPASTGTISASSLPLAWASAAFCWLRTAKASWSARVIWCRRATFSAVSPMEMYAAGKRSARPGLGIGLKPIIGTRDMLSTPAQRKASPAPMRIAPAAWWIDCIDEPQKRFTVAPATVSGRPAMKATSFATFSPCSPSGKAQPRTRSSIVAGSRPVCSTSAFTTWAAMSSGRSFTSSPLWAKAKGLRR